MITDVCSPFGNHDVYRDAAHATTTLIHPGEQIYLRQNYKHLIGSHAVNVIETDSRRRRT
jgi:L-alanine-DL-glutamate epimerase-like enolase superfamily enzyme